MHADRGAFYKRNGVAPRGKRARDHDCSRADA
jgi:hypothetical protein